MIQCIERRPALHRHPRPEHQVADILDARLHGTFLPALRRRTKLGPERIRAPERLERLGFHPVPAGQHLLDRQRRVVQDDTLHDAAEIRERRLDSVEQRFEPLKRVGLGEVHVAAGQGRHQILDLARHASDVGPRFTEVDLHRRAGTHATVHEGLLRRRGRFQRRHIPAHRARGDRSGQRQQQPTNPLRRQSPVLAKPLLDLRPPRVQAAGARRRHPHRRRRLLYGAAYRLHVQLQPPGNFLLWHLLHQMQVANLGPLRHPDHLRVLLAESTRRPCRASSIITRGPLLRCAQGVPFHVATGSLFILPLPQPLSVEPRSGQVRACGAASTRPVARVPRSRAGSYRWPVREPRRTGGRCPATAAPGHAPVPGGRAPLRGAASYEAEG